MIKGPSAKSPRKYLWSLFCFEVLSYSLELDAPIKKHVLAGDKVRIVVVSLHVNGRSYAFAQTSILNLSRYPLRCSTTTHWNVSKKRRFLIDLGRRPSIDSNLQASSISSLPSRPRVSIATLFAPPWTSLCVIGCLLAVDVDARVEPDVRHEC